jgi:short-subunit dehydrogenase
MAGKLGTADKFVLITGASSGIGRETALALDRAGYYIFAGVRRIEDGTSLQHLASPRLTPLILDVRSPEQISSAFLKVKEMTANRGLFALINNAGFNYNAAYEYTEEAKARALMDVNVFGVHALSVAMLPLLRVGAAASGTTAKLVNLGSIGSLVGIPWEAFYHASKFAVLGLSESIHSEVYAQNIRVSVVMPGGIKTAFIAKSKQGAEDARAGMPPEGLNLYGKGLAKMAEATNMVDRFGSSPELVALRIKDILAMHNPPFRALVGNDAKLLNALRAILPTSFFHALLRKQFGC